MMWALPVWAIRSVSREAPAIYAETLKDQLTPVDAVMAGKDIYPDDDTGAVMLLTEQLQYVLDDGRRYALARTVVHIRSDAGIRYFERATMSFDRTRQRLYLIDACTIDENGRQYPLDDNAAFIHAPQEGAAQSLYTTDEELVLVFPNVHKGATVAYTVLLEEDAAVIPGEFDTSYLFVSYFPRYRHRVEIDLPESMAARLRVTPTGENGPAQTTLPSTPGRVRYGWKNENRPGVESEAGAPSWYFMYPAVWMTTLPDWDAVATWYRGLLDGRGALEETLQAEVDTATAGLTEREAIIRALATLASDKVRYVGLEFGLAGYQPYNCNAVWSNGYGDCKDKSNLLVAMLRAKGIPAYVTLLNTEAHGDVQRQNPGWRQFNHAIVAVDQGDGTYLFIDPTVEHLIPGTLPPSDKGRDVLIIGETGAIWARTPDQLDLSGHAEFDLTMSETGTVAGWGTYTDGGPSAAFATDAYNRRDNRDRREYVGGFMDDFVPGAEVLDVDYTPVKGPVDVAKIRAFVRREATSLPASLAFPFPTDWVPELATRETRRYPYRPSALAMRMDMRIALPAGRQAGTLPSPFEVDNPAFRFAASWQATPEGVAAHFENVPRKLVFTPEDYLAYRRALLALKTWMGQPLLLVAGDRPADAAQATASADILDFPLLATGEGQLRLLDQRFPSNRDTKRRRQALERVLQWFPEDHKTQAEARAKIALIDWDDDNLAPTADEYAAILQQHGEFLDASTRDWIRYMHARSEFKARQTPTALETLEAMARDPLVDDYRRAWAGYCAAEFAHDLEDLDRTEANLWEALAIDDDGTDSACADAFLFLHEGNSVERFLAFVERVRNDPDRQARVTALWIGANQELPDISAAERTRLAEALQALPAPAEELVTMRNNLQKWVQAEAARQALAEAIRPELEARQPSWWKPEDAAKLSNEDLLDRANETKLRSEGANLSLQAIFREDLTFEQQATTVLYLAWWFGQYPTENVEPFRVIIEEKLTSFPADADGDVARAFEIWADQRLQEGQAAKALELARGGLALPEYQKWVTVELAFVEAQALVQLERDDEALEVLKRQHPNLGVNKYGTDLVFLELLIHLRHRNLLAAKESLDLFATLQHDWLKESAFAYSIFLADGTDPQARLDYWLVCDAWLESWTTLCQRYGVAPLAPADFLVLRRRMDWSQFIAEAAKKGDKAFLEALRPMVLLTLLCPDGMTDLGRFKTFAPVNLQQPLRTWYIASTEGWSHGSETIQGNVLLYNITSLIDSPGREQDGLQLAKETYARSPEHELRSVQCLRAWLLAEVKLKQSSGALDAAQALLRDGEEVPERKELVREYGNALIAFGETDRLAALIAQEETRLTDPAGKSILDALRTSSGEAALANFPKRLQQWVDANAADWYAAAWPESLLDLKRNMFGQIELPPERSGAWVKYQFLEAQAPGKAPSERMYSAAVAIGMYLIYSRPVAEIEPALADMMADQSWPLLFRAHLRVFVCQQAQDREQPALIRAALDGDPEVLTDQFRAQMEVVYGYLKAAETAAPEDLASLKSHFIGVDLTYPIGKMLNRHLERLGYLGQLDELQATVDELSESIKTTNPKDAALFRRDWKQIVAEARRDAPYHAAMRELLVKHYGPPPVQAPALFGWYLEGYGKSWLGDAAVADHLRYALASGRLGILKPEYHLGELKNRIDNHLANRFGLDALELMLNTPAPGNVMQLRLGIACPFDPDIPDGRERFVEILQQHLATGKLPGVVEADLRHVLAIVALRVRQDPRLPEVFDWTPRDEMTRAAFEKLRLAYFISRDETEALQAYLENFRPSISNNPENLVLLAEAYEKLGRSSEAEAARTAARAKVADRFREDTLIDDIWRSGYFTNYAFVFDDPTLFPPVLEALVLQREPDAFVRQRFQIPLMAARHEWPEVIVAADALLQQRPEQYAFYGYRAIAHAHLGHYEAADRDFAIYTQWCSSEMMYPTIVRRFQEAR